MVIAVLFCKTREKAGLLKKLNPDAGASGFLGNWKLDLDLLAVRSRGIGSTIHAHGERNNADNRENFSTDSFHELDKTMFGRCKKFLKPVSDNSDTFRVRHPSPMTSFSASNAPFGQKNRPYSLNDLP
jgi:hypothetical protein